MKASQWKCGLSACVALITNETFEEYARAGIDCMEVSCSHINQDKDTDYKALKKWAKDSGVELWSYHLPFSPFGEMNIATLDKDLRKKSIEHAKKRIDISSELGIGVAVIHPSGEPNNDTDRSALTESAKECLQSLAQYGAEKGVVIAVEDLPRTCLGNCSQDILELISADSRLRICFDTNHLLKQRNIDFIKACGDKIITTHVSDYDFLNERHWLPYEGDNDWVGIVSSLEEAGYCGPFLFELSREPSETISRPVLEYKDFYDCYKACVNKLPFEAKGTRVDEACHGKSAYYKTPIITK